MISTIDITLESTPMIPCQQGECWECGAPAGHLKAQRISPSWVKGNILYYIWAVIINKYILALPISHYYCDECLPEGWKYWTIEIAEDMRAFHSFDSEKELMDILMHELNNE